MLAAVSRGIHRVAHLETFLQEEVIFLHWFMRRAAIQGVVAWGRRPSAERAEAFARKNEIKRLLRLEDGFLRSVYPGASSPTCSLVVDDLGVYYDASGPSRLEAMVATALTNREYARARSLVDLWRDSGLSKYNHTPAPTALPQKKYILVIDQTANDASVQYGLANADSFRSMLDTALETFPDCQIVVKEHPEVALGRKRGYLGEILDSGSYARVTRLQDDVHVVPLLRAAQAVFVVTSQVGFEALLHGKPVYTFGMPFYAGWGLTRDNLPAPARRHPVTLEQLAFGALVRYTRYVQPHSGERCEVEDAIAYLALQRRMRQQFPQQLHAIGFSRWKRPILRQFLQGHDIRFHRSLQSVPRNGAVVRWGRLQDIAARDDLSVITVEDGFLRSVGLGAQLVRPVSWVFDRSGIYYDATNPSDLEQLLGETNFDDAMLKRAGRLRELIVQSGLTKYNVGEGAWRRPAGTQKVILVVGQVETDASLRFGAPGICTNRGLLEAVHAQEPDSYIVYKPHPDVMAGLRGDKAAESALGDLCDELVSDYPMHQLITAVDRVHVLTSLAGFEALLRGKPVTVHGAPFYAGWGLTDDRCTLPRRRRLLSLDMLVAGALILYPRYVLRDARAGFASPEQAVAHMLSWSKESPKRGIRVFRRVIQPFMRRWTQFRDASGISGVGSRRCREG